MKLLVFFKRKFNINIVLVGFPQNFDFYSCTILPGIKKLQVGCSINEHLIDHGMRKLRRTMLCMSLKTS